MYKNILLLLLVFLRTQNCAIDKRENQQCPSVEEMIQFQTEANERHWNIIIQYAPGCISDDDCTTVSRRICRDHRFYCVPHFSINKAHLGEYEEKKLEAHNECIGKFNGCDPPRIHPFYTNTNGYGSLPCPAEYITKKCIEGKCLFSDGSY